MLHAGFKESAGDARAVEKAALGRLVEQIGPFELVADIDAALQCFGQGAPSVVKKLRQAAVLPVIKPVPDECAQTAEHFPGRAGRVYLVKCDKGLEEVHEGILGEGFVKGGESPA